MDKSFTKFFFISLLSGSCVFLASKTQASPSRNYQNQDDCWNNYDFITPEDSSFRYCIDGNGAIAKFDMSGQKLKEKNFLNTPKRERISKKGLKTIRNYFNDDYTTSYKSYLAEYSVEDDELIKYYCKNKKVNRREYEKSKECFKSVIGIRSPFYYYLKGIEKQSSQEWNKSIEYLNKQINLKENKEAFYSRAYSKFNQKDYVGSLNDVNEAIKISQSYLLAYDLRSKIKKELNDFEGESNDLSLLISLLEKIKTEGAQNKKNIKELSFIKNNNSAYLIVEGPTWEDASKNANKLGGKLVSINDFNENKLLVKKFSNFAKSYDSSKRGQYWIGYKYIGNNFEWSSDQNTTFINWKVGNPSEDISSPSFGKITLYSFDDITKTKNYSGKWSSSNKMRNEELYGIAEINVATTFKEIDPLFENVYFRRALSRSQISERKGALSDFNLEIINNPTNGQAYFQRGLEKYWINRKDACKDLIKGISLGAKDTSKELILKKNKNIPLISDCKDPNNKKIKRVNTNYAIENFYNQILYLISKTYIAIPILLIVIVYIFYSSTTKSDE